MTGGDPPARLDERCVVASVDRSGPQPRLVIAERDGDGASLSALQSATRSLREWR